MRRTISDSDILLGTTAIFPESEGEVADSNWSSLRPDSTCPSSGPWQAKHRLERMGRISVLKSTLRIGAGFGSLEWAIEATGIIPRNAIKQALIPNEMHNNRFIRIAKRVRWERNSQELKYSSFRRGSPKQKKPPQSGAAFEYCVESVTRLAPAAHTGRSNLDPPELSLLQQGLDSEGEEGS